MANIEIMAPHILTWEVLIKDKGIRARRDALIRQGAAGREIYNLVAPYGFTKIPGDRGGATMCGVTIATFREWTHNPVASESDLKALKYDEWLAILRHVFWDRCRADLIANPSIALMMVDWCWLNGATTAIRQMQATFGLATDGIIGSKSLAALNAKPADVTFARLRTSRLRSYDKIVARSPSQMQFYKGWVNRTNSIEFKA